MSSNHPPSHCMKSLFFICSKAAKVTSKQCPGAILRLERSVFLKNFEKLFFNDILILSPKDLSREYLVVPKFLFKVPKFKENVLISVMTVIKVRDLLLTLLQVIAILAA